MHQTWLFRPRQPPTSVLRFWTPSYFPLPSGRQRAISIFSMLFSPCKIPMSSVLNFLSGITLSTALHLLGIILLALLVNRFLGILTKLLIKPASGQSRAAQAREQQTRTLAAVPYNAVNKVRGGGGRLPA